MWCFQQLQLASYYMRGLVKTDTHDTLMTCFLLLPSPYIEKVFYKQTNYHWNDSMYLVFFCCLQDIRSNEWMNLLLSNANLTNLFLEIVYRMVPSVYLIFSQVATKSCNLMNGVRPGVRASTFCFRTIALERIILS